MEKILRNFKTPAAVIMLFVLFLSSNFVSAQKVASVSGDWNNTATWGGAAVPTNAQTVTINAGVAVTISSGTPAVCSTLQINNSTGTATTSLTIAASNSLTVGSSGTGTVTIGSASAMGNGNTSTTTLTVSGNLTCGNINQSPGARTAGLGGDGKTNLTINSTGNVTANGNVAGTSVNGTGTGTASASLIFSGAGVLGLTGALSTTVFSASTGTVNYRGTGAQTIAVYPYYNLYISSARTTNDVTFAGSTTIAGDLNISATSSTGEIIFNAGTSTRTFTIGGDYIQSGNSCEFGSGSGTSTINLTGDFVKTGGYMVTTTAANATFNLVGTAQNIQSNGGTVIKWIDFNVTSGSTTTVNGSFNYSGGSTDGATFTISSGGTLLCGTNNIVSSGVSTFSLASGGTLGIGSAAGITTAGTATGNIQTTTRTFSTGGNYIYNGGGAQAAGSALPATLGSLSIANNTTLTLPSAKAITNNFSIAAGSVANLGTFSHTAGTLTMGGFGTPSGSHGSTTSSATNKNNTFFAATTGIVTVGTGTCSITAVISGTSTICNGGTTNLSVAVTGGLSTYTVVHTGGTVNTYTSGTNIPVSPTSTTAYTLSSVKDSNGCSATNSGTATVTVNAVPSAGTLSPNVAAGVVCEGQSVSATLTAGTGGAGTIVDELERSLSGGAYASYTSGAAISTTGQTSVSIRTRRTATGSGCTSSGYNTVTWTVNAVPTSGTLTPNVAAGAVCSGQSVSATATAGSGGAGTIVDELERSLSGSAYAPYTSGTAINTAGQTSVSIRTRRTATGSGCTASSYNTVTWTVNAVPSAGTLTPTPAVGTICSGSTVSATAAAGSGGAGTIVDELEYSLSGGAYAAYTSGTSINTSGQTSVSIRTRRTATGSGCTSSGYNTVSWTVNPLPISGTLTPNVAAGTVCSGQVVSATATAGSGGAGTVVDELERSLSGGAYAPYTSGTAISTTGQTSISIRTRRTATGSGCTASSYNTVTWTVNAVPASGTLTPTPAAGTICSGGAVSATATAGSGGAGTIVDELEYSLSGGSYTAYTSGTSINTSGQTSISIRTRRTATGSGCTSSSYNTVSWTINAAPASGTLTPTPAAGTICSGGTVSATATAGSGGAGTIVDELQYSLSGGSYTTYTSGTAINTTGQTSISIRTRRTATGSSCTSSSYNTVTWNINARPTASVLSGTGSICYGSSTNLQVAITGGTSPYSVVYSGGSVGSYTSGSNIPVSPTSTTTYTLTSVTDANGCVGTGNSGSPTVTIDSTTSTNGGVSWSNGTPSSTKSVVFDGSTATLAADFSACSLRLTNSAVVNVNSGINVTLNGKIIVDSGSTFTLNNTSNLIQNTNIANTGNIIVKRNSSALKRLDYTLWSSPVTGQGLYAFSPFTFANRFYVYNTSNDTYSNSVGFNITGLNPDGVNGTDSNNVQFASAKGYLIRMPWNHPTAPAVWNGSFTGVPNNGNVSFGMTTGYNAVGNPYPSRINVHNFIDGNTNISGPLYFWRKTNDTNSSSYATLTKTAYVANGAAGGDTGTGFFNTGDETNWVINIGQGFLVNATSSTNLNFTNSMRRSSTSNQFFKDSQNVVNTLGGLYWLNLNAPTGIFSQMAVGYSSEGTLAEDRGIDGKNINTDFYLTSLIGSTEYSIQGRPDFDAGDVVPLSYKATAAGNYTISIDHTAGMFNGTTQAIYLRDLLNATEHNLQNGAYAFTSDAGTFNNRFEVAYETQLSNPEFTPNTVIIYSQNNEFVINSGNTIMSSVKVFDIRGRLLLEKGKINASQTTIKVGDANQVLLIQITSEDGAVVTKKVIR